MKIVTIFACAASVVTGAFQNASAISRSGTLMCMGSSDYGQLGTNDSTFRPSPVKLAEDILSISSCGSWLNAYEMLFIDAEHNLYGTGGDFGNTRTLLESGDVASASMGLGCYSFVRTDGTLVFVGQETITDEGVALSSSGSGFCLYVKTDGSLWGLGKNLTGTFGLGKDAETYFASPVKIADNVTAVSAGYRQMLYVTTGGELYGSGGNDSLSLTAESDDSVYTPVLIDTDAVLCVSGYYAATYLKKNGDLVRSADGAKTVLSGNVLSFSAGYAGLSVWFTEADGSLRAWGDNNCGSLGTGGFLPERTPVTIVDYGVTSVACGCLDNYFLTADGSLWGCGDTGYGQLGNANCLVEEPSFLADTVVKATGGFGFTLYLLEDGTLYGLGRNDHGQLGLDHFGGMVFSPTVIARDVIHMAAYDYHTLYLTGEGVLYALGDNSYGQLGVDLGTDGTGAAVTSTGEARIVARNIAAIAAGGDFSLYLTEGGVLYGVGYDVNFQLGVDLGKDGDDKPILFTSKPQKIAENVDSVAAGISHTLFLTEDGVLYALGGNYGGQLGVDLGTDESGNKINYTATPQKVAESVRSIAAGGSFSLYVTDDNVLHGMGDNSRGQLGEDLGNDGNGDPISSLNAPRKIYEGVRAAAAGYDHTVFLTSDRGVYTLGNNTRGQLGVDLGMDMDGGEVTFTTVPHKIGQGGTAVGAGLFTSYFVTLQDNSCFFPNYDVGAKWDRQLGWIDDTFFPWEWSYASQNWFYVYAGVEARPDSGYWIGYFTTDGADYGWAYVYSPDIRTGVACLTSGLEWRWIGVGEAMP